MAFRVSLHNHSVYSDRGHNKACRHALPVRIVKASLEHKLDGVAITDTNNNVFFQRLLEKGDYFFGRRYETKPLAGENVVLVTDPENGRRVFLYNGVEFHSRKGIRLQHEGERHLLVVGFEGVFYDRDDFADVGEVIDAAEQLRGIVIAPHPINFLGLGRENVERFREKLDAIEGFNSQIRAGSKNVLGMIYETIFDYRSCNEDAKKLAKELNIPAIASSDSNSVQPFLGYTVLESDSSDEEKNNGIKHIEYLRRQIRENRFRTVERYISLNRFFCDYGLEFAVFSCVRKAFSF